MSQLLVVAIVVLVVLGLVTAVRSRHAGGDPSSSVQAFNRALTALEPGTRRGGPELPEPVEHAGDEEARGS